MSYAARGPMLALPLVLLGIASAAAETGPAAVTLTFTGLRSHSGEIRVEIYDDPGAWDQGRHPVRQLRTAAAPSSPSLRIEGLTPGRYAVRAFHDLDGDGRLRTGAFGAPLEPFAFSNNARGRFGPASWSDASFGVVSAGTIQSIRID